MVSFTAGSGGYYFCNTLGDMVGIDAMRGDCANVRGDVYMFNGGSWTLMFDGSEYRNLLKPEVSAGGMTESNMRLEVPRYKITPPPAKGVEVACLDCKYVLGSGECKIGCKSAIHDDRCSHWTPQGGILATYVPGKRDDKRKGAYFGKPPYSFGCGEFWRLDHALTAAWWEKYDVAIVSRENFSGSAEVGDTVVVSDNKRWKIKDRFPNGDYVLERVDNPARRVKTPPLRTIWE